MNFDSMLNGTKFVFSSVLLLVFSTAAFAQLTESTNLKQFNYYSGNESIGSKMRTRPRIFVETQTPTIVAPIATDKPAATVDLAKPPTKVISTLELEKQAFALLNQRRVENGLQPVVWNEDVAKVARNHSQNMASNNYFSHQGLDGSMVDDRADSAGLRSWKRIGENIAYNRGYDDPVEFAVLRWMQSTSHRENLLSNKWTESGVGIAVAPDGKTYYFTQVFMLNK